MPLVVHPVLSHLRAPTKGPQVGQLGEGAAAPGLRCCSHWVSRPQGRRCGPQLLHSPRAAGHLTTRHTSDLVSWCAASGTWPSRSAASRSITSCARSPTPEPEEGGSLGGGGFCHTSPPNTYTCLIRGIQRGGGVTHRLARSAMGVPGSVVHCHSSTPALLVPPAAVFLGRPGCTSPAIF